jgi:membrane protease YdiL (CAAX protease family)
VDELKSTKQKEKGAMHPIVLIIFATLLFFGSQILAAVMIQPLLPYIESQNIQLVSYSFAGLIVLIMLLQVGSKRLSFTELTGIKKVKAKHMALVFPALLAYLAVSVSLTIAIGKIFSNFDTNQVQSIGFSSSLSGVELFAVFVSLVIITPILEEIIFRGVLFRGLRKRLSFWPSAIFVSVLFAVAHAQWNVALDTFALSLALCYLVEKSGSILPSIALHSIKNGLAFALLFVI